MQYFRPEISSVVQKYSVYTDVAYLNRLCRIKPAVCSLFLCQYFRYCPTDLIVIRRNPQFLQIKQCIVSALPLGMVNSLAPVAVFVLFGEKTGTPSGSFNLLSAFFYDFLIRIEQVSIDLVPYCRIALQQPFGNFVGVSKQLRSVPSFALISPPTFLSTLFS